MNASADMSRDAELARNGNTAAFARLYALVYEDMYHIALYSLKNSHDACDAVSEAVLDAFRQIATLRDGKAFRGWIMKILSAKIKRAQKEYFNSFDSIEEQEQAEDFSFENTELRDALSRLEPVSRLILSMTVLGGYTSEEVSQVCGLKASAVRSRLTRIKKQLRVELSERGKNYE